MPKDDFYTPTDIDALRMENELLTFEVRFLKAQLAEPERSKAQLEESSAQLEARLEEHEGDREQLRDQLTEVESSRADLQVRLEGVERDLVFVLRRLANSPLGRFLRREEEIRSLERRYLGIDA